MISSKQRMINVLKGQLMYINEDSLLTEVEKAEATNIIINMLENLLKYKENSTEIIDLTSLNIELFEKNC